MCVCRTERHTLLETACWLHRSESVERSCFFLLHHCLLSSERRASESVSPSRLVNPLRVKQPLSPRWPPGRVHADTHTDRHAVSPTGNSVFPVHPTHTDRGRKLEHPEETQTHSDPGPGRLTPRLFSTTGHGISYRDKQWEEPGVNISAVCIRPELSFLLMICLSVLPAHGSE